MKLCSFDNFPSGSTTFGNYRQVKNNIQSFPFFQFCGRQLLDISASLKTLISVRGSPKILRFIHNTFNIIN